MDNKKSKTLLVLLIFAIALIVNVYFGFEKKGFHEDEYYTYFSSNRSLGLYQPDRQWQDRQTILDEFVVKEGEGFNYGLVKLVQSWDVHPPFYYYLFHTACSMVPGVFTKWTGIIVNLIAFGISFWLLFLILRRLKAPTVVEATTLLFWAINPMTISCNMLIRMYAWLTAAIFACGYFHIRLLQDYDTKMADNKRFFLRYMLPIMVVSYLGFLTQYFYIFFFAGIGLCTFVWLIREKLNIVDAFLYAVFCGVSLILAVITYPASVRHLLGGYRGNEATGGLLNISETGLRLKFFIGLLNDFVFSGGLVIIMFMVVAGTFYLMVFKKKHIKVSDSGVILTISTAIYFLLTAKSALLLGSASNRYEMPIYGFVILLFIYDLYLIFDKIGEKFLIYTISMALIALLLKGILYDKRVLFLYQEDVVKTEFASENADKVAIVMFNPATPHNVWRLTDELIEYPKVYYMDEENLDKITDPDILSADKIILYVADNDKKEEAMENLKNSCDQLIGYTYIVSEDMWTTYELQ